jgi:4-hydroxy-tetrahydrodipicolinate synthase
MKIGGIPARRTCGTKDKDMTKLTGIIAPILTPFDNDGGIALDLWVDHAQWVLAHGAHYLSPFGTTGEALLLSVRERKQALEALIRGGIAPDRLMPGTGVTSLVETVELTAHATNLGVAATMVLPSFFYADAPQDGHVRYFEALVQRVADDRLKICLYNIPKYSGTPVTPALAAVLNRRFAGVFVAYKDSSGDWDNTAAVIGAAPGLAVFAGSETFLVRAASHGGAGCISATANLNAAAIRNVYESARLGLDASQAERLILHFRAVFQDAGLIPGQKSVLALRSGDARWLNLRAPLMNGSFDLGRMVMDRLGEAGAHIRVPG